MNLKNLISPFSLLKELPRFTEDDRSAIARLQIVRIVLLIAITLILRQVLNIDFSAEILCLGGFLGITLSERFLRRGWTFPRAFLLHFSAFLLLRFFFWEWNAISDPSDAHADFNIALYEDSSMLVFIWYVVAFVGSWLYWCREWAVTLEGTLGSCLLIWLLGGHRNYHLDAPKQITSLSWKLAFLQKYQIEPQHLFLILAAFAALIFAFYFIVSSKRPLYRGDSVERARGEKRLLYASCLVLLGISSLLTYAAVVSRNYAAGMSQATQGVGLKPSKDGESNLGFHSAMGGTKQPAALVRLEGDYPSNPSGQMLYFREGALSQFNGKEYVQASLPFDADVPRIKPGQPYIADADLMAPTFTMEFFEVIGEGLEAGSPYRFVPAENRLRLSQPLLTSFFESLFPGDEEIVFNFPTFVPTIAERLFSKGLPYRVEAPDGVSIILGPTVPFQEFAELFPRGVVFHLPPPSNQLKRQKLTQSIFLLLDHNAPFAVDYPTRIGLIKNPDPNRFSLTYQAISQAPAVKFEELAEQMVGNPLWDKEVRKHYLEAPGSRSLQATELPTNVESAETKYSPDRYGEDLRYLALARRLTKGLSSPIEKVEAIVKYLSEKSVYTRAPGHVLDERGDPVAPYLFAERKRGYCVHFAHAAVFLFRLAGVPSRIGTGYLTDLQYSKDGHILLSLADRHAWPEVYIDGYGWTVYDLNPAEAENEQAPIPDSKMLEDLMNKLDNLGQLSPPGEKETETVAEGESLLAGLLTMKLFLFLLSTSALFFFAFKSWLRFGYLLVNKPEDKIRRSYSSFASQMFDLGAGRDPGETRQEHAARVAAQLGVDSKDLSRLLEETTYGEKRALSETKDIDQKRKEFQRSLKHQVPWWKRALSFFNPASLTRFRRW